MDRAVCGAATLAVAATLATPRERERQHLQNLVVLWVTFRAIDAQAVRLTVRRAFAFQLGFDALLTEPADNLVAFFQGAVLSCRSSPIFP